MEMLVELYKKELEVFLATLGIYKRQKRINTNEQLNNENKMWLKKKFIQLKSGNVEESALDIAIDELIPYLQQHGE